MTDGKARRPRAPRDPKRPPVRVGRPRETSRLATWRQGLTVAEARFCESWLGRGLLLSALGEAGREAAELTAGDVAKAQIWAVRLAAEPRIQRAIWELRDGIAEVQAPSAPEVLAYLATAMRTSAKDRDRIQAAGHLARLLAAGRAGDAQGAATTVGGVLVVPGLAESAEAWGPVVDVLGQVAPPGEPELVAMPPPPLPSEPVTGTGSRRPWA